MLAVIFYLVLVLTKTGRLYSSKKKKAQQHRRRLLGHALSYKVYLHDRRSTFPPTAFPPRRSSATAVL
jgi:hypothetical protein